GGRRKCDKVVVVTGAFHGKLAYLHAVQSAQHARDLGGVPELELLRPDEHGAERALLAHHPTVVESRELQGTLDLLRSVHRHARERLRDLWERDGHGRDA